MERENLRPESSSERFCSVPRQRELLVLLKCCSPGYREKIKIVRGDRVAFATLQASFLGADCKILHTITRLDQWDPFSTRNSAAAKPMRNRLLTSMECESASAKPLSFIPEIMNDTRNDLDGSRRMGGYDVIIFTRRNGQPSKIDFRELVFERQ
ncbi:hypothetical protein AVEN_190149-1 [Araneus ventricosus]|uniref:Uncharacterized protein n=1 Tax=Araneus ventricosus TaxID=182803 RepID=A0A4Y2JNX6_ARAVE|nr:hypothetical protein AVEN_190149-1 [Araneus ventricosus]